MDDRLHGSYRETAIWETDQPLGEVGSVLEVSPTADGRDENVVQTYYQLWRMAAKSEYCANKN